eukprot:1905471-Amphidinium_carterae.1
MPLHRTAVRCRALKFLAPSCTNTCVVDTPHQHCHHLCYLYSDITCGQTSSRAQQSAARGPGKT